jgi:hypothetical protein
VELVCFETGIFFPSFPVPLSFVEYGEEDPRPELSKAAAAAAVTIGGLGLAGSAVAGAGANGNDALDVADESVLVADGPGAPRLNSAGICRNVERHCRGPG